MLHYNGHAHTKNCFITFLNVRNKLVQLVVQVKYHMNIIYSVGGGHTHTRARAYRRRGQKQFQETRYASAFARSAWFKLKRENRDCEKVLKQSETL